MRRLWRAVTHNAARTKPDESDVRLLGRTYAIPFDTVWRAAVGLADGGLPGWTMERHDDRTGVIAATSVAGWPRWPSRVVLRIGLDPDAQTRVDLGSSTEGRRDLGVNARRIGRFLAALDRAVEATARRAAGPAERVRTATAGG